jgi:NAD(P)-dependent dehydrogenase (short-subunit alcohol dehydrogenase family)
MNLDLKNKKVLVTGSSQGIGLEILKKFSSQGCNVIANSRNMDSSSDKLKSIKNCNYVAADVTKPEEAEYLITKSIELMNGLDILVCNVGSGSSVSPGNETFEEWQKVFLKNFFSTTNCVESSKFHLAKSNGSIVCISSICGSQVITGAPVTYSVAKSSLNSYVKSISKPLSKDGIRINAISPGNIIHEGSIWETKLNNNPEIIKSMLEADVPMNRFGNSSEIADLVLYLSSDISSFVTGSVWDIDGGQLNNI